MTSVPTDMALHTTCIAGDFVHQLFACHVGVRLESVLPPLALDVPTMLACRQLARALADAYLHPIELNLDMIQYNEALNKRSTGRLTKHEEALLQKFPHGHIILWYLPDAISLWIQAEMEEATVGMGHLLKTSMTGGEETQWRTFPGYFHHSNRGPLIPGCINMAPCWFQQGREPYGFPPTSVFAPEVSATLKGECGPTVITSMQRSALLASAALRVMHPELYWASVNTQIKLAEWAMDNGLHDIYTRLQLWASVFNCAAVICNRQCPLHRDPRSAPEGCNITPGAIVACSGHIVRHGVTFTGDRVVWTWFMRDSLHNFVGTPRPQYAKYKDVDSHVSVSASMDR
ncbi:uncharacterized protein F5147DRAFT_781281 [Suillus discolor]|uniref:Uncharacterized protein n=1 Tax=Suillus discolor TaxID=1912936 RepID=A0A9P7ERW9_9AGAM|nr:uncharacterized protein F5147DRAFT_781281 [Suillus discolor]KAG2087517.1 hypothetical protein F5147DRAFT_781281 [Suillus discolor]